MAVGLLLLQDEVKPGFITTYQDKQEMQRRERENILKALGQSKGKIYGPDGAASILGIKPTTLASWMKKFKVAAPKKTGA